MKITLPNNTDDNPSLWDTEKKYAEQSEAAKIYIMETISKSPKNMQFDEDGIRAKQWKYEDKNIEITKEENYKAAYPSYELDEIEPFGITVNQIQEV
ncbi:MAG: hypothetical protein WC223_12540 [Bacteroidales bacterium]|jgi:hypothetical protein